MMLSAVSEPSAISVPGTLLEMLAGMSTIGMQNCGNWARFSRNSESDMKPAKLPTMMRASMRNRWNWYATIPKSWLGCVWVVPVVVFTRYGESQTS